MSNTLHWFRWFFWLFRKISNTISLVTFANDFDCWKKGFFARLFNAWKSLKTRLGHRIRCHNEHGKFACEVDVSDCWHRIARVHCMGILRLLAFSDSTCICGGEEEERGKGLYDRSSELQRIRKFAVSSGLHVYDISNGGRS